MGSRDNHRWAEQFRILLGCLSGVVRCLDINSPYYYVIACDQKKRGGVGSRRLREALKLGDLKVRFCLSSTEGQNKKLDNLRKARNDLEK
jgi:hypothetical protein